MGQLRLRRQSGQRQVVLFRVRQASYDQHFLRRFGGVRGYSQRSKCVAPQSSVATSWPFVLIHPDHSHKYLSFAIFDSNLRISARARKARTLTRGMDQPVSSEISLTVRSSISSRVRISRAGGESCSKILVTSARAASAFSSVP